MKDHPRTPFRDAHMDRKKAQEAPETPQTRAPAYRLALGAAPA